MAGLDFNLIKRINLGVLVAAITLVVLRRPLVEAGRRKLFSILLGVLSLFAVVNYANYFSFHGEQTFIHWHDVTHYYLGSKYSGELGYEHLYTAMLRAEAEIYDDHFVALEARDLKTNSLVDIRQLLRDSDAAKERFDPERWRDFKLDVELLHQELGPHWASVLRDHGYNPTPVWTTLVSQLTGRIPAGSRLGIELLTLLDPLILLLLLVVIARTFGLEAATWVVVYFCVIFGATFGWTGGALLRYLWFLGVASPLLCCNGNCPT